MKRKTRVILWITLVVVAICMPTMIALNITRSGNWWVLLYLIWVVGIELFILMLLKRKKGVL